VLAPCGSDGDGMAKSLGDAVEEVLSEGAGGACSGWDIDISLEGIGCVDCGWLEGVIIVCTDGDVCASTGCVVEVVVFCTGETVIVDWLGMGCDCGFEFADGVSALSVEVATNTDCSGVGIASDPTTPSSVSLLLPPEPNKTSILENIDLFV